MYDIAIIGSGPAGANLARLIGDKYKVLLLDKRDFYNESPINRPVKCCGGLLAPDAQKMIAKLGLGIPKDVLVTPQLFAVRAVDLTKNLERLYQRFYFNIDRGRFDRWLVSLIPPNVDKRFNALFRDFSETSDGYEIKYLYEKKEISAKARIVVGADGAFSAVRKHICGDTNTPKTYIAIQERFECADYIPYFTAIFDEQITDFYSWIIPKENYLFLGSALAPGESAWQKFDMLKTKLAEIGFNFNGKVKTEGAYIYRPKRISQFFAGKDNVALIGEAAGAISPSSAEGISYALKSSLYLAASLENGTESFLERYKKMSRDILTNLFLKNIKSPAIYNPALRYFIIRSGLQSIACDFGKQQHID